MEFEKLPEETNVKLLEKFHDAIEFYTFREAAAFVLRVDGETDAALSLSKSDEPEIPKEEFEKLPDKIMGILVGSFGRLWGKDFKFGNKSLKAAAKKWCQDQVDTEAKFGHISGWNVSKVTSMRELFSASSSDVGNTAKQFNADLSRWNVTNVTVMNAMFKKAESFNSDLSSWNMGKVENMGSTFDGAKSFNKNTIMGWELKGKDTYSMFGEHEENEKLGKGTRKL